LKVTDRMILRTLVALHGDVRKLRNA